MWKLEAVSSSELINRQRFSTIDFLPMKNRNPTIETLDWTSAICSATNGVLINLQ
jgi:hypothetical protein